MIKKPKQFTIDRKKWLRGEGSAGSALLRVSDNKMCCLGFYSLALGCTEKDILNIGEMCDVDAFRDETSYYEDRVSEAELQYEHRLMSINDDESMSEIEREALIVALFAQNNVEVNFIN